MSKQYLTIGQLSKKLGGRSRSSLYRDFASGRLPEPIKIGGRPYSDEEAIDRKLAEAAEGESKQ